MSNSLCRYAESSLINLDSDDARLVVFENGVPPVDFTCGNTSFACIGKRCDKLQRICSEEDVIALRRKYYEQVKNAGLELETNFSFMLVSFLTLMLCDTCSANRGRSRNDNRTDLSR